MSDTAPAPWAVTVSSRPCPALAGMDGTRYHVAMPWDMRPVRRVYWDPQAGGFCTLTKRGTVEHRLCPTESLMMELGCIPIPRLDGRADFDMPGARLVVRWNTTLLATGAAWALGVRRHGQTVRVAGGGGFRPAPRLVAEYGAGSRKVGEVLAYMAFQALPGSGSGIAGDADSLADWTPEGVTMCDLPGWHDAIGMLADDE